MSAASCTKAEDRWSQLNRQDIIALGKTIVTERLENLGCTVTPLGGRIGGKLRVETPSGRAVEVFVSTQRLGGYVFWTKRRFTPRTDRFAAVVLLTEAEAPAYTWCPAPNGAERRLR